MTAETVQSNTLRQRQEYQNRIDAIPETKIAWFSGWLCADGSIKHGDASTIKFTICDRDPLEAMSGLFGNNVQGPYKPSGFGKRDRFVWGIRGFKAQVILSRCIPWLSARYLERAKLAIALSNKPRKPRRLTDDDVRSIKRSLKRGKHGIGQKLAIRFGVTDGMISSIKYGRTWGYLNASTRSVSNIASIGSET